MSAKRQADYKPISSPLAWVGGKRYLRDRIVKLIPPHHLYIEPFFGAGWVFFAKPPSKVEIINDLDDRVVNFFRVLKHHPHELAREMCAWPSSRRLHAAFCQDREDLTDVQRAARFIYLVQYSYGARMNRRPTFSSLLKASFPPTDLAVIEAASERLAKVRLETLDFAELLKRCDRPQVFVYCDPPYVGVKAYRHSFSDADHERLAELLRGLKANWLLSYNDHPLVRRLYAGCRIRAVSLRYTIKHMATRELLISNY